jgi:hypothetical protein
MEIVSYAVYDADSGEVVHVHVEPAYLRTSPDEVLHHAGLTDDRKLSVLRVASTPSEVGLRVENGELHAAGEGGAAGGGASVAGFEDTDLQRRYESSH